MQAQPRDEAASDTVRPGATERERRALIFMTGSMALDVNQRLDARTQASLSTLLNDDVVNQQRQHTRK